MAMFWRKKGVGKAKLCIQEGIALQQRGQFGEARKKLDEAVGLLRKANDQRLLASALSQLSQVCYRLGDAKRSIECIGESAAIRTRLEDFHGLAVDYQMIGTMMMSINQLDPAHGFFSDSLGLAMLIDDKTLIAAAESNLGLVAMMRYKFAEAEAHFQKSQTIRKQLGDQLGIAKNLNHFGKLKEAKGQFREAEALYRESLSLLRVLGAPEAEIALDNLQRVQRRK